MNDVLYTYRQGFGNIKVYIAGYNFAWARLRYMFGTIKVYGTF